MFTMVHLYLSWLTISAHGCGVHAIGRYREVGAFQRLCLVELLLFCGRIITRHAGQVECASELLSLV